MHVWEEARAPGENPLRHRENIKVHIERKTSLWGDTANHCTSVLPWMRFPLFVKDWQTAHGFSSELSTCHCIRIRQSAQLITSLKQQLNAHQILFNLAADKLQPDTLMGCCCLTAEGCAPAFASAVRGNANIGVFIHYRHQSYHLHANFSYYHTTRANQRAGACFRWHTSTERAIYAGVNV